MKLSPIPVTTQMNPHETVRRERARQDALRRNAERAEIQWWVHRARHWASGPESIDAADDLPRPGGVGTG